MLVVCSHRTPLISPNLPLPAMLLVACMTLAAQGTIDLTPENFDKEVFASGKAAFIKFLAPW